MTTTHKTRLLRQTDPDARVVLTETRDGVISNTRIEIRPAPHSAFHVSINQVEKLPRHKRGLSRSVEFVISREGLAHLRSVGEGA